MALTDTSEILLGGMTRALAAWERRSGGAPEALYWVLRLTLSESGLGEDATVAEIRERIPPALQKEVWGRFCAACDYWDDIRYATLEPVTKLWGTIVNGMREAAESDRATATQKRVFAYPAAQLVDFFLATREQMRVADELYHAFKAMPAPECQALAALLNVHVDAPMDERVLCRLVRLLDHEGPLSEEERQDLTSLSNTGLVHAAFRGVRAHA